MGDQVQPSRRGGPLRLVIRSERDLLALSFAARKGNPSPELIQHTIGSREAATKATDHGSVARSRRTWWRCVAASLLAGLPLLRGCGAMRLRMRW